MNTIITKHLNRMLVPVCVIENTLVYEQSAKELPEHLADGGTVLGGKGHTPRLLCHVEEGTVHQVEDEVVEGDDLECLPQTSSVHLASNTQRVKLRIIRKTGDNSARQ